MEEKSNYTEEYVSPEDFDELDVQKDGWKERAENFLGSGAFWVAIISLVAITSFSFGRISGLQDKREPVRVINSNTQAAAAVGVGNIGGESVVGSKNGTKYHYPWCAGAKQISSKNLITFESIEKARAAGYTPASNCKGLK